MAILKYFLLISAASYLCFLGRRTGYMTSLTLTTFLFSLQPVFPELFCDLAFLPTMLLTCFPNALDLLAAKSQGLSWMFSLDNVSIFILKTDK